MRGKSIFNSTRLAISLLITLTLVVPAAYLASPWVYRQIRVGWLTSQDMQDRQRGLSFVTAHARKDGGLLAGAVDALRVEDETNFQQIVAALQAGGCWSRDQIPDDPWLRWIALLASVPDTEAGSLAAQRLADLNDLVGDPRVDPRIAPRVIGLLEGLLQRDEPDVRYNALCAVAELAMSTADRSPYERMIAGRTSDPEPLIVRHAWLFSYYLDMPLDNAPVWLSDATQSSQLPNNDDAHFTLKQICALLLSPQAPLRDVGCVLAVRDLEAGALDSLVADLLRDMNDQAKMSGPILAGLTGLHLDLLHRRQRFENDWEIGKVILLGQQMCGEGMVGDAPPATMAYSDAPRSTVILAMLHRMGPGGLEVLLNPRGEPPADLPELMEDYGWWRVLNQYLPADAPRWHPGADATQQRLQTDMLRDWYLVHRHRFLADRTEP